MHILPQYITGQFEKYGFDFERMVEKEIREPLLEEIRQIIAESKNEYQNYEKMSLKYLSRFSEEEYFNNFQIFHAQRESFEMRLRKLFPAVDAIEEIRQSIPTRFKEFAQKYNIYVTDGRNIWNPWDMVSIGNPHVNRHFSFTGLSTFFQTKCQLIYIIEDSEEWKKYLRREKRRKERSEKPIVCQTCGSEFKSVRRSGDGKTTPKYCSNRCRQAAYRRRKKDFN